MLEIAIDKVVYVIFLAREGRAGEAERRAFIAGLDVDEQAHLTAIAWVGRGSFEPEEYADAVATAQNEASAPTEIYLGDMPDLAEALESGLEALGIDVAGAEENLL